MPESKDRIPRRKSEHVEYEGGAEVEDPVDPSELPAKRSDRAPPGDAGRGVKGQGEAEAQHPPDFTPAANEALAEKEEREREREQRSRDQA